MKNQLLENLYIIDSIIQVKKLDMLKINKSEPAIKKDFASRIKLVDDKMITQTFLLQQQKLFEQVEQSLGQLNDAQMFMLATKLIKLLKIPPNDMQSLVQIQRSPSPQKSQEAKNETNAEQNLPKPATEPKQTTQTNFKVEFQTLKQNISKIKQMLQLDFAEVQKKCELIGKIKFRSQTEAEELNQQLQTKIQRITQLEKENKQLLLQQSSSSVNAQEMNSLKMISDKYAQENVALERKIDALQRQIEGFKQNQSKSVDIPQLQKNIIEKNEAIEVLQNQLSKIECISKKQQLIINKIKNDYNVKEEIIETSDSMIDFDNIEKQVSADQIYIDQLEKLRMNMDESYQQYNELMDKQMKLLDTIKEYKQKSELQQGIIEKSLQNIEELNSEIKNNKNQEEFLQFQIQTYKSNVLDNEQEIKMYKLKVEQLQRSCNPDKYVEMQNLSQKQQKQLIIAEEAMKKAEVISAKCQLQLEKQQEQVDILFQQIQQIQEFQDGIGIEAKMLQLKGIFRDYNKSWQQIELYKLKIEDLEGEILQHNQQTKTLQDQLLQKEFEQVKLQYQLQKQPTVIESNAIVVNYEKRLLQEQFQQMQSQINQVSENLLEQDQRNVQTVLTKVQEFEEQLLLQIQPVVDRLGQTQTLSNNQSQVIMSQVNVEEQMLQLNNQNIQLKLELDQQQQTVSQLIQNNKQIQTELQQKKQEVAFCNRTINKIVLLIQENAETFKQIRAQIPFIQQIYQCIKDFMSE